jgi:hypothetical protein
VVASPLAAATAPLVRIRADLEECGTATLTPEDIEALWPDDASVTDQFLHIAEIARAEDWDVDYNAVGVVRLSSPIDALRLAMT